MKLNLLSSAFLLLGLSSSSIPRTSATPPLQAKIMGNFDLCVDYWVNGTGAAEMIAEAEDPLAVTKIAGVFEAGSFHQGWITDSIDDANSEVQILTNIFPGNQFLPVLGPFPDSNIPFCGKTTDNPLAVRLSSTAFGGFDFFEFSVVNDTQNSPVNAYTTVIRAAGGGIVPFYNSVATSANCTELIKAFSKAGTPAVSILPDSATQFSVFIRTVSSRWEVVCGFKSFPDPCLGRPYGTCETVADLQQQVAELQAKLAAAKGY